MIRDGLPSLTVRPVGPERPLGIRPETLVIAGYTGVDASAIESHIAELARLGVPPPESTPAFFRLDPALLTTDRHIHVESAATSGEVEPVLIRAGDTYYLGVGSDHTDRELEVRDLIAAKQACPKVLGQTVLLLTDELDQQLWQQGGALSWADGLSYQSGRLAQMLTPRHIWRLLTERLGEPHGDTVVFLGTLPLIDGQFRYGKEWTVQLDFPTGAADADRPERVVLRHEYGVTIS